MKQSVRKAIDSREACDNLRRFTCKMNSFSGHCEDSSIYADNGITEQDEIIVGPKDYSKRHRIHHSLAEAVLNILTLGLFSRMDVFSKHM